MAAAPVAGRHPLAARRILRLALGTALCLWASQVFAWPLSFVAPVLTLMLLGLPMPAPSLKMGIGIVVALLAPMLLGMLLLPVLQHARWAGVLLVALALYYSFLFTARGGSPALGNFMTIGLTLVVTVGSVNADVMVLLVESLAVSAVFGVAFVWIAHALLPDPPRDPATAATKPPAAPKPDVTEARRRALRAWLVVFPLALVFLFISGSPAYTVVMIKAASMGQEATTGATRQLGRSLLASTFWGGLGAVIAWNLMKAVPTLTMYVLLAGLAGLLFGRGIFQGAAVRPDFQKWSYAYVTMMVVLAPSLIAAPATGGADAAFWTRLGLFVLIAIWGGAAVAVFDAFRPPRDPAPGRDGTR